MTDQSSYLDMTSDIVSAYLSNHSVRPGEIADLISAVHASLIGIGASKPAEDPTPEMKPAVAIKKSVTDEFIISLEDGRKFKSMKRYLAGLGMTPNEYRAKWGLPRDYPMVAPGYAAKRSELAKAAGLGASRRSAVPADAVAPMELAENDEGAALEAAAVAAAEAPEAPARRRGRPRKAA